MAEIEKIKQSDPQSIETAPIYLENPPIATNGNT